MIKTVMFDLDGTILPFVQEDFIKLYFGGLSKKLASYGYEPEKVVKYVWKGTEAMMKNDGSRLNSEEFWDVFRAAFPGKPDVREKCDEFYVNEFDAVKSCLKYIPNHKPMIDRLKEAGFEIVLATNPFFPKCAVNTRLAWVGLSEDDFSYISHYDNSRFCKPNLKYFREILEEIGRVPSECVMIGNSVPEDIIPAQSLGIEGFLITEFSENPGNEDITKFRGGTLDQAAEYILSL